MTIKTLRHKGNSIKKLLTYMIEGMENQEGDLMIAHNLPSFDLNQMIQAYLVNDTYRQAPAQVRQYHEILSFSPRDSEHLSKEKLEQLTLEYIKMRNSNALCFAVAHMDSSHTHIHLCFSGTEYRHKKTLRMDDATFRNLRVDMERYQQKHFPELKHSLVYLDKEKRQERAISRDRNSRAAREFQYKKRGNTSTEKEVLIQIISDTYDASESLSSFYNGIEQKGLELSYRNGEINGVKGKRKYRFATLGITTDMLQALARYEKRMKRIEALSIPEKETELEL